MSNPRVRKIADRIQVIVAEMLERRIKDPRLGFVTITDVRVTGDTQQATIFYTVLGEDERARGHRRRARVGQGPDPLRGRQAARHAAHADADVRPRRPPGDGRATSTTCWPRPRRSDAAVAAARAGATYAGEADPYKKPATRSTTTTDESTQDVTALDGLVVVDKPGGLTSHDVVARVRRLAGTRKVGHAGTLDPMATGVLVLGVDRATRLLGHLTLTDKAYDATIRLGVATTTDDAEGEVVATADAAGVDEAAVARRGRRVRRRDRAGAVGGLGDQGRRPARLRAGPGRRGGRARRRAGDRPRARRARRHAAATT